MNRQYWRPQLHYIYLLYIFYSIMYLISPSLYISIRKTGVLQQQSKRASLEEKEGKTTRGPAPSKISQAARRHQLPYVPASLCHVLLLDRLSCLDPVFSGFVFCSLAEQMVSLRDHRTAQANGTGAAESPTSREVQGTATPSAPTCPKTSSAQPQTNPHPYRLCCLNPKSSSTWY